MNEKTSSTSKTPPAAGDDPAKGSEDQLTRRNVEGIRKLEQAAKEERSRSDLVAEAIANFCGSMTFVWVHVAWFGGWIVFNAMPGIRHIDPFPFTFLTLVVSLEAIFLSTFILISQNHDTRISERRNHLDLQINLLSEQENTKMLAMLQAIADKIGAGVSNDRQLQELREETQPERLVKQIKEQEEE
ncbi:MAG TPA: DUF1003 domain-containing protein [Pyrinomonadaceae bacterium]|jgi:uncharacterized membrane protein